MQIVSEGMRYNSRIALMVKPEILPRRCRFEYCSGFYAGHLTETGEFLEPAESPGGIEL